jgi:hypothetical protein
VLETQRTLRLDVILPKRMPAVPQGKAASDNDAYQDAYEEKPAIGRERYKKHADDEERDKQAR